MTENLKIELTENLKIELKNELKKLTQQSQRQDSTMDQLRDLYAFANKLGLYDAADFIRVITSRT